MPTIDRAGDQPPAPEAPGEPDEQHDRQRAPRPLRRRAPPTARRATRARRTGRAPSGAATRARRARTAAPTNQSVTSSTIPTITALPIRPSPIPRTARGRRRCEHDERGEGRDGAAEPERLRPARVAAPRARARAREKNRCWSSRRGAGRNARAREQPRTHRPRTAATASVSPFAMRIAVISDIHAQSSRTRGGARRHRPSRRRTRSGASATSSATGRARTSASTSSASAPTVALCGNHDLAVIGTLDISDFSGDAAAAARWTQDVLGARRSAPGSRRLQPTATRPGAELFHGSPRDPVWDYVLSEEVARFSPARDDGAARARRPQPRRARARPGTARRSTAASPRQAPSRAPRPAAGCSTPARSGSRATATRGPRGC